MTLAFAEKVVWHAWSAEGIDDHGNEIPAFDDSTLYVALWPTGAEESPATQAVSESLTLATLGTAVFGSQDEFTARGARWKVQGNVQVYRNPFTSLEVSQVTLRRLS